MINNGFKIGEKVHIIGTGYIGKIEHINIDSQTIEISGYCRGDYKIEELELLDNQPVYFVNNGKIEEWSNKQIEAILNKKLYYNYGHYAGFSESDMDYYIENRIVKNINIEYILWCYEIEKDNLNYWNREDSFTKEDIIKYFISGKEDTEESDNMTSDDGYSKYIEDKEYHIKRIVYFMRHPEYIKEVPTFVEYKIGKKYYDIIDGLHRVLAGLCLGLTKVESIVLNEEIDKLKGDRNKK